MKLGGMDLQRCLDFLYLLSSIIIIITLTVSAADRELVFALCDGISGNYTQNSTYQNNLNTLLSPLSSNVNDYGFYNASAGQSPDTTTVVAMCRGDVELSECRKCVNDAAKMTVQSCPVQKEAFGGYDECTIRYSNNPIIGSIPQYPYKYFWTGANVTSTEQFNQDLRKFLDDLRNQAANNGSSFLKFAAGKTTGPDSQPIYALVQCIPDLSAQQCSACLNSSFEEISSKCLICYGKTGASLIWPSCNVRYDSALFFGNALIHVPAPPPQPQSGGKEDDHRHTTPTLWFVIVAVIVVVVMVPIIVCIVLRKRRKMRQENGGMEEKDSQRLCRDQSKFGVRDQTVEESRSSKAVEESSSSEAVEESSSSVRINSEESPKEYKLIILQNATDNFSITNKIGEGGFGTVYKGELDNQSIAVKRLSENSRQGILEFKNEVDFIAKLQHNNLVKLLGYCQEGREMILVYEFVSNGGLDGFLFDRFKREYLDWEKRYKIIENIARGLVYLHEDSRLRIIHRDIKTSNILLDADLNPKIADFGMAKLFALNQAHGSTNTLVGAYGYMAPEYARYGKFSEKSDVYSFGVLVLEIISGQKNTIQNGEFTRDLLSDVWTQWKNKTALNVIDSKLRGSSIPRHEIKRCIHVALLCVQESVNDRPKMSQVVHMLSRTLSHKLPEPFDPGFFTQSTVNS